MISTLPEPRPPDRGRVARVGNTPRRYARPKRCSRMIPDLERIAVAVQTCPAVAGLHPGPHDTITTDTPQGRMVGLAVEGQ
jgi:hypothetical protein